MLKCPKLLFNYFRCCNIEALYTFNIYLRFELDNCVFEECNGHEYRYRPNSDATVADVTNYAIYLEALFAPVYESLSTIVFVVDNKMKLLEKYVSYWNVSQFRDDTMMLYSSRQKMKTLNAAVKKVEKLIYDILNGTATIDDLQVTCKNNLKFDAGTFKKQKFEDIKLEKETELFQEYSKQRFFKRSQVDLKAVYNDTVQLFQMTNHLATLREACEQFELYSVLSDPIMTQLQSIEEDMMFTERRSQFTVQNVSSEVAFLKAHLCIQDDDISSHACFQLVAAVKKSNSFYKFAKDRGFNPPNGSRLFKEQYQIVTENLANESYRDIVMDHLLGSFKFFEPFLHQESKLVDLMEKITELDCIDEAIEQIKTVNKYAPLIRFLFDSAEVSIAGL